VEEGDSQIFVANVGLAIAMKMYPDQSQAFEEANNSQPFPVGRKTATLPFWTRLL